MTNVITNSVDLYIKNLATFNLIKKGKKKVEVRLNKGRYSTISSGTSLNLICGNSRLLIKVKKINIFHTYDDFLARLDLESTCPLLKNKKEVYPYLLNYYSVSQIEKFDLLTICFQ